MTFGGDKPNRCGLSQVSAEQPDKTPTSVSNSKMKSPSPALRT